jgi:hypothetical protein
VSGNEQAEPATSDDYLHQVMAEIDEEVRQRRREIPVQLEQELDQMFLEHAPVAVRGGDLRDALGMVDQSAFIDPVVPVDSQRVAGSAIKKGLRSLNLWYMGWVTHQVSTLGLAVSRALHAIESQLADLQERVPPAGATKVLDTGSPAAWWAAPVVDAVRGSAGRVLHAACGDGWLVGALVAAGVDAYGVDPRLGVVDDAERRGADLRQEEPLGHVRAIARGSLGGAVLSGITETMEAQRRDQLVSVLLEKMGEHAVVVVHSMSPAAWLSDLAPVEADLAPGRPLRARTWAYLLSTWTVDVLEGPDASDYLVIANR